ncbi:hypothetical protein [Clostridium vincentii]|uniref:Uncharacterized protein n=1 Tax=Clostridium vincentii TaxID=52704 RepID=A0A2T0BBI3_9CLOT|nr:hypothetical protein [Clostridium vincentii]PRR81238.1 hypothetical protein CLVI_26500 [Clostridium vincentii]
MAKINSKNNNFLFSAKDVTSHIIYPLLVELVNSDREDLAKLVKQVDYLLVYTSTCIKQKDFKSAKESIKGAEEKLSILKEEKVDTSYLDHIYEGIKKKIK